MKVPIASVPRRIALALSVALALTACLPFAWGQQDSCRMRPVAHVGERIGALLAWTVTATSSACVDTVVVDDDLRYEVVDAALRADPGDLAEHGVVTASNTGFGGRVHELPGVPVTVGAALEVDDGSDQLVLLIGPEWTGPGFPSAICDALAEPGEQSACDD